MRKYEVGIDLTFGKYITVEANSIREAEEIAKKQSSNEIRPRGYHFVGVQVTGSDIASDYLEEEK